MKMNNSWREGSSVVAVIAGEGGTVVISETSASEGLEMATGFVGGLTGCRACSGG